MDTIAAMSLTTSFCLLLVAFGSLSQQSGGSPDRPRGPASSEDREAPADPSRPAAFAGAEEVLGLLGLPQAPHLRDALTNALEQATARDRPHYSDALQRAQRELEARKQAQADFQRRLRAALPQLSDQEQAVVSRRYGLDGGGRRSQAQVGRELGVSASTVGRVERRALARVRALSSEPSRPASADNSPL